jgi:hypothetical protein
VHFSTKGESKLKLTEGTRIEEELQIIVDNAAPEDDDKASSLKEYVNPSY